MIYLPFIILVLYVITLISFLIGYKRIRKQQINKQQNPTTHFSVIIPFRNEAIHLPALFKSIEELHYPKSLVEFILVNDESLDESYNLAETFVAKSRFSVRLLNREKKSTSPKKDAITTAINKVQHEWIITTDADCILPPNWLASFNEYISENTIDLVAASVHLDGKNILLHQFQILEHLSLQTVTVGSFGLKVPIMCNGANLAYKKTLFIELNGFEGNNHLASGDDLFLLEKAVRVNKAVGFLKSRESIVSTSTQASFLSLLQQRIRWASKTTAYKNWLATWTAWITLLVNLSVIALFIVWLFSSISSVVFFGILLAKCIVDFSCLLPSAIFQKQKTGLLWFALSETIYPFWVILVAILSLKKDYVWKERKLQ